MNKFPPTAVRERLAREVGGTMRQIQVWFQNRRQRDQSHHPANHGPLVIPFVPAVPGFYPPQQGPLSPYGAQGLPQPFMYGQPPMVPMHGALQNGFLPGPPQMPIPGAPGAVSMPMAPMPMPIQPGNAANQPPQPPHSRARLSTLFAQERARDIAALALGPSPAHAHDPPNARSFRALARPLTRSCDCLSPPAYGPGVSYHPHIQMAQQQPPPHPNMQPPGVQQLNNNPYASPPPGPSHYDPHAAAASHQQPPNGPAAQMAPVHNACAHYDGAAGRITISLR